MTPLNHNTDATTQTVLHTTTPDPTDYWRPTLTTGVWMHRGDLTKGDRTLWLSQRRTTGTWTVTDTANNELAEYRPDHYTVTT